VAKSQSALEDAFLVRWLHLFGDTLPHPVEQFTEVPPWLEHLAYRKQTESARCRRWVADYAIVEARLVIEISGGLYATKSGHTTAKGIERDYAKSVIAASGGWLCLHLSGSQVTKNDYYLHKIAEIVKSRL
jgi:very-short-patch-repair endonuclease